MLVTALNTEQTEARKVVWSGVGQAATDGAGVKLTRVIGTQSLPDFDPFLMLDEFGSDDPDAYIAGFPDHPHRGFETVTYMLAGRMRHRDSRGNEGLLEPGSVQWMTAASGLVHSEMPEQTAGLMRGFQLWVNLPAADKMGAPRYQDIAPDLIPAFNVDGIGGRVIAGSFAGVSSPVETGATEPLYVDLAIDDGAMFNAPVPPAHNAFVYVYEGQASIGLPGSSDGTELRAGQIGILSLGNSLTVTSLNGSSRLLLIAGKPIREPIVKHGPFVMNTAAEIHEAFADYQANRF